MVNTQWLLKVDEETWGYVVSEEEAIRTAEKIANMYKDELLKENPHWNIDLVKLNETVKVKCINPGYIFNSRWTAHRIRYEPVSSLGEDVLHVRAGFKVIEAVETAPEPPPRPQPACRKRARRGRR